MSTYQLRLSSGCVVNEDLQVLRLVWVDVADVVSARPFGTRPRVLSTSQHPLLRCVETAVKTAKSTRCGAETLGQD